jgi:hypothetical protein
MLVEELAQTAMLLMCEKDRLNFLRGFENNVKRKRVML